MLFEAVLVISIESGDCAVDDAKEGTERQNLGVFFCREIDVGFAA